VASKKVLTISLEKVVLTLSLIDKVNLALPFPRAQNFPQESGHRTSASIMLKLLGIFTGLSFL